MHYTADLFMRGYFGIGITLITFISNLNAFEKNKYPEKKTLQKWWEIVALARRILLGAEPTAESFPMAARIFLCKLGIRSQTAAGRWRRWVCGVAVCLKREGKTIGKPLKSNG